MKRIRKKRGYLEKFQNKNNTIIIGIIGAIPSCGVTTMSVAVANYLAGITRKKVAIYEYSGKGTIMKMNEYFGDDIVVSKNGCTYFPKGTTSLASLYNNDFPIIVVDFGTDKMNINEFARCTHNIVMSSLEPWNHKAYNEFINILDEVGGSNTWLWIINGDEKNVNRHRKDTCKHIIKRPCIDNPFIIDTRLVEFFEALF